MLPDPILPTPEDDIARTLTNFEKRLSSLESLEGGAGRVLIEEFVLAIDMATIDFQNIPATFRHLEIIASLRGDRAAVSDEVDFTFNGDVAFNYDRALVILQSTYVTTQVFGDNNMELGQVAASAAPAGKFNSFIATVPNYADTTIEAAMIYRGGKVRATSGGANIGSFMSYGEWRDASAVDQITITPAVGANWVAGSIAALYGLR